MMKTQDDPDTRYLSYMLRLWRKRDGAGQRVWCVSLEEPGSHQTARLGDLRALVAFLQGRWGHTLPGERAQEESLPRSSAADAGSGRCIARKKKPPLRGSGGLTPGGA